MSKTSLILSILMTVAFALLIAPGVFAMNHGKVLRNIALWLVIFTGLALIYKNFGPDSEHPLFSLPPGVAMRASHDATAPAQSDKTDSDKANGSQGFTPPGE
jgi:ABC-type nickel/cobalt efflux system permease component RcnA